MTTLRELREAEHEEGELGGPAWDIGPVLTALAALEAKGVR